MLRSAIRPMLRSSTAALRSASGLGRPSLWSAAPAARCAPCGAARLLCTPAAPDAAAQEATAACDAEGTLLFEGGKARIIKTLKMASLANLGFAAASAPVLHYITSQTGHGGTGVAMAGLLLFFGGGTTAALTWATGTYVLRVHSMPGKEAVRVVTPTLLGGERETEVAWADVVPPQRYHPFSTFQAGDRIFYFDDVGTVHDEALLSRLEAALAAGAQSESSS
jgi:hypothetical protein